MHLFVFESGIGACTNSCHFDWGMLLGCFWKSLWGLVGASWGLLGTSWGPLGSVAAGKPLVGLLGASWGPLGGLSKTIKKLGVLRFEASFHCKIQ